MKRQPPPSSRAPVARPVASRALRRTPSAVGTGTLDLALRLLENLAHRSQPASLGALAKTFSASKATVYRHLQALRAQDFVHQNDHSGEYEIGIKLVVLGEAARGRFDIVRAGRAELIALRDTTRQAATVCGMVQDAMVVLDLIQGHTVIEFGVRPGTRMTLDASAHGKAWLAFSDAARTHVSAGRVATLAPELARIRKRGWATAPSEVVAGVNALAAPVFDHTGGMTGSIAIVGATQFIPPEPARAQIEAVVGAARRISRALGWQPRDTAREPLSTSRRLAERPTNAASTIRP
ncbi:MAG: IclR family transcriptional regulator [Hyphomicrobiales bacterium]|nr:IclR family transcriptional regulator [Hyphomicrobiales bacterium]